MPKLKHTRMVPVHTRRACSGCDKVALCEHIAHTWLCRECLSSHDENDAIDFSLHKRRIKRWRDKNED